VRRIKQATIRNVVLILSFASFASATLAQNNQSEAQSESQSQSQSLGDVARQARAAKSSAPKSAIVLDDDNMPKSKGGVGGSAKLSPDKQAYCDELRQRKDPDAEQGCAALAVDMGPEYEDVFARYVELAKNLCAANGGRLPSSEPKDPALSAQWHELITVSQKFGEVMNPETKLLIDAEKGSDIIRQEEIREFDKSVPDWRNPSALAANPREKQRYTEITAEYNARIAAHETATMKEKAHGQRFVVDMMRLRDTCTPH
jgi:type II secretory pathway pseudopilin PulG